MKLNIIYFLLKIFNFIPLLHFSQDKNFDTISRSFFSLNDTFRISLIALNFGTYKIYLITISIIPTSWQFLNFRFFDILSFDQVQGRMTAQDITKLANEYEYDTLKKINTETRLRQEEFLKMRISENNDALNNIFNKLNYYTTIILAFSAALVYAYSKLNEIPLSIATTIIYSIVIINVLDIFDLILLLRRSVSISGFIRSTFKNLRTSNDNYSLTKSLYFDWIASTNDVKYYAGLTKNAEMRSVRVILTGFLLLICATLTFNSIEQENNGSLMYLQNLTSINYEGSR